MEGGEWGENKKDREWGRNRGGDGGEGGGGRTGMLSPLHVWDDKSQRFRFSGRLSPDS